MLSNTPVKDREGHLNIEACGLIAPALGVVNVIDLIEYVEFAVKLLFHHFDTHIHGMNHFSLVLLALADKTTENCLGIELLAIGQKMGRIAEVKVLEQVINLDCTQ